MGNIFGRLIVLELDESSDCKFMISAALNCLDIYYSTQGQLTKQCSIDNLIVAFLLNNNFKIFKIIF